MRQKSRTHGARHKGSIRTGDLQTDTEQRILHLSERRAIELKDDLPAATLAFLRDHGVPERVEIRGVPHTFSLGMEPLHDGYALKVDDVEGMGIALGLHRYNVHLGMVIEEKPEFLFVNCSVESFLSCCIIYERLGEFDKPTAEIASMLRRGIEEVDPVALKAGSTWSALIEEIEIGYYG